jgi:hypothetical protein
MPEKSRRVGLVVCLAAGLAADASVLYANTLSSRLQEKTPPKVVFSNPKPSEIVQIDGSKNPEMIPQWNVWGYAFRVIAGGPKAIPTVVLSHLSDEEAALLHKEAETDEKNDVECQERVLKLIPLLSTDQAKIVNEKTREINLDCRWQTLHARDRVLAGLSPEGQAALVAWVESNKAGMHVSVPKRELAFFRQPQ